MNKCVSNFTLIIYILSPDTMPRKNRAPKNENPANENPAIAITSASACSIDLGCEMHDENLYSAVQWFANLCGQP